MADLTPEQIAQIQAHAKAFEEEFTTATDAAASDASIDPNVKDLNDELDKMVPDALGAISYILKHSENAALKGTTARWLIDKKLASVEKENDPLTRLLSELTKEHTAA